MLTEKNGLRLKVLGTRGSMTICRQDQQAFGGNTSCYMVQAGEETIFLDAGSGLLDAPVDFPRPPHILLSHLHLDHLLGLGMYPRLSQKDKKTLIYVPVDSGGDRKEAACRLAGVFSPPYWPLSLDAYSGDVQILPLSFPLKIGDLVVEGIPGSHPGGCFIFILRWKDKRIVYATDYEYDEASFQRLMKSARGADLVLFDGQYTPEELAQRKGFGHSSAVYGMKLMEQCGIGRLLLVHHDPQRTDRQLQAMEEELARKDIHFAREGEEILL
ncbi:MAG: MBL fold metallo-hydrolase [Eubacteriales bacterium]|nr:MBL fold metallo-hydrolase [Eubacteriales bacterium]